MLTSPLRLCLFVATLMGATAATASPNAAPAPNPDSQTTDAPSLPTGLPADKASSLASQLASYESSLLHDPKYTSYLSAIAAAIPTSELASIAADPLDFLASVGGEGQSAVQTGVPDWWSAVGDDAKGYVSSVVSEEEGIIAQATGGAVEGKGKKSGAGRLEGGVGLGVVVVLAGMGIGENLF